MNLLKKIAVKTAAVIASLLLFLIVLEGTVRVFNLSEPRTGQRHPIYGTSYIPGRSAINSYGVRIEIGEHGHRGPTPTLDKPKGVFRVVMLGDSFLQAVALPFDRIFYSILNRRFADQGLPIEVINLGVEGYGTIQEYLVYHHEARRYHPDLVMLFCYFANDLQENYPPCDDRPGARIENGELVFTPFKVKHRGPVRDFLRANVMVYNYLPDLIRSRANLLENKIKNLDPEASRRANLKQFEESADVDWPAPLLPKTADEPDWELTLAVLEKLHGEVERDGARLVVGPIPNVSQIYDRFWKMMVERYPLPEGGEYERFRPQEIVRRHAEAVGYGYMPLAEELTSAAGADEEMFFIPGDLHFNIRGNEVMADLLEPVLLDYYRRWSGDEER